MAEPWVRVHANIAGRPLVGRAVAHLGVSENEAIGLLVRLWGQVSQHVVNGDLTNVPDYTIEQWVGWKRKRGLFAEFIRANHLDASGRVKEWDDYAGKLEDRRERDRQRKANRRPNSAGIPAESQRNSAGIPADVRRNSIPARAVRDDTKRDDTDNAQSSVSAAEASIPEPRLTVTLPTDAGRTALTAVLEVASSKAGVVAELDALLSGARGERHHCTTDQLDVAVSDYVSNGMSSGRWNAQHFRACVRRAMQPPPELGTRPTNNVERSMQALRGLNGGT